jgi:hypothetical protein
MTEEYKPYVVTQGDDSQILVSIYLEDGEIVQVDVATRPDPWATWLPPVRAERG